MPRTLHKTDVWQCQPHRTSGGVKVPIHKNIHDGFLVECSKPYKTHLFYSPTSTVGVHLKNLLKIA